MHGRLMGSRNKDFRPNGTQEDEFVVFLLDSREDSLNGLMTDWLTDGLDLTGLTQKMLSRGSYHTVYQSVFFLTDWLTDSGGVDWFRSL